MSNDNYLNLITSMYRDKPKFTDWLSAALTKLDSGGMAADSFTASFDLDTALGAQLDMIGDIVGLQRTLPFQPSTGNPVMGDDDYRLCIKAKIAKNQWDGTITHIYDLWGNLGIELGLNLIDNQNMTMTVKLTGSITDFQKDLIAGGLIVPKPQAVKVIYELISAKNTLPVFVGIGTVQETWYKTRMQLA